MTSSAECGDFAEAPPIPDEPDRERREEHHE
jgi:hypothetical protein